MNRVVARLVLLYVEPRYLANACCAHSSFNSVTNSIQFLRSYVPIYRRLLRLYIMELYSGSYERQQPLLAKWSHVINEMRLFNGIMDSQQRAALSSIATFGRPDLLSVIVPEPHRTTRTICSKMLDHALSDKWEHPSTRLQTVAAFTSLRVWASGQLGHCAVIEEQRIPHITLVVFKSIK